jgi:lipid-A-disaccharide synthase-like uncharacterized protein
MFLLWILLGFILGTIFGGGVVTWTKSKEAVVKSDVQSAEEKLIP